MEISTFYIKFSLRLVQNRVQFVQNPLHLPENPL